MAITESVKNLEVNPSLTKNVVLDIGKVVPLGEEGDEKYVLTSTPSTGVTATGGVAITPVYIREFKNGYSRSAGHVIPPFDIDGTKNTLQVSIDGSAYQEVTLTSGVGLTGSNVAEDLQAQVSAIGGDSGTLSGNLSFLNASVKFEEGRFTVYAGSISNTYTGPGKTSVSVIPGSSNDASLELGFNIPVESEALSSIAVNEAVLVSGYTASGSTMDVSTTDGFAAGHAFMVTDGTNKEYFTISGVTTSELSLVGAGLDNSYAIGSVVQRIFERDPHGELESPLKDIDAITRFSLNSVANQIDFSS